jgi:hypothetical protein
LTIKIVRSAVKRKAPSTFNRKTPNKKKEKKLKNPKKEIPKEFHRKQKETKKIRTREQGKTSPPGLFFAFSGCERALALGCVFASLQCAALSVLSSCL